MNHVYQVIEETDEGNTAVIATFSTRNLADKFIARLGEAKHPEFEYFTRERLIDDKVGQVRWHVSTGYAGSEDGIYVSFLPWDDTATAFASTGVVKHNGFTGKPDDDWMSCIVIAYDAAEAKALAIELFKAYLER